MKEILIIGLIVMVGIMAFKPRSSKEVDGEGITFHQGTWNEALERAKKENKLIFLDSYASWCGPCKRMKSKTFTDSVVAAYYNANFINVAMDAEKGEGIELAKRYKVRAYPTLLFINGKGELISESVGYYGPNDFLKLGKTVSEKKLSGTN